jgi:hypothetical protein
MENNAAVWFLARADLFSVGLDNKLGGVLAAQVATGKHEDNRAPRLDPGRFVRSAMDILITPTPIVTVNEYVRRRK